ncbi:hypothetical protein PITC_059370 [Penicillium italicum]|uniref:Rhodopsin domain-containing protein n=1 Tax=Penicillium italicum TaxID=40296 RepID=A0A0A2LEJ3_PENIT|nr:hypothetical protein PITC_059370 [Penicillium italicum]
MAPSKKGWQMIETISVLVGLCLISLVLRVVARIRRRVGFGIDDYLNMIFLANQFTYFLLCPCIKISIICFYRRIFATPIFQKVTFGINCLIAAWGTGIFLACAGQCRPLRAYWDANIEGTCFDAQKFIIVNQAFNVVMDFVILVLPIPMIWNLHRAWQDKLALNGVFALGVFVCFSSIYRIVVLFWISPTDTAFTVYQATLWTHIEPSVGLICSNLPIIRGLFPAHKLKSSRNGSGPTYVNTDYTSPLFLPKSSPRSPDLECINMYNAQVESESPGRLGDDLHPRTINVQTDISILPGNDSTSRLNH